jgi:hypothetical protein
MQEHHNSDCVNDMTQYKLADEELSNLANWVLSALTC